MAKRLSEYSSALAIGVAAAALTAVVALNNSTPSVLAAQGADASRATKTAATTDSNNKAPKLKMRPTGSMAVFTQNAKPLDLGEAGGDPM